MFFNKICDLNFLGSAISIFAAVFIAITIYVRYINRSNEQCKKQINKSITLNEDSPKYVSIDHRRLLEMIMNK